MATKQLQIVIKGTDGLSAPMRAATVVVVNFGEQTLKSAAKAEGSLSRLFKHFTSVTGIVQTLVAGRLIGGVAQSFGEAAEKLNEVGDIARRFEIPVEQLKELRVIGNAAGVDIGTFARAIDKAQGELGVFARTGGGAAAESLKRLRIPLRDANGEMRNIVDILPDLAAQIERLPDNASRLDVLSGLFGKADDDILQVLNLGFERIARLRAEAAALPNVFTPQQVRIAQDYRQAVKGVQEAWLGLKIQVFENIGPTITDLGVRLARVLSILPEVSGNFMRELRQSFTGGEEGDAASQRLIAMFEDVGEVVRVGIGGVGRLALVATSNVLDLIFTGVDTRLGQWIIQLGPKLGIWLGRAYNQSLINITEDIRLMFGDTVGDLFQSQIDISNKRIDALVQSEVSLRRDYAKEFSSAFKRSYQEDYFSQFKTELDATSQEISTAMDALEVSSDAVLGWGEAWDRSAAKIDTVIARLRAGKNEIQQFNVRSYSDSFFGGLSKAADDLNDSMQNLFVQGQQIYGGIANTISGNLSTALVNAAGDVRNLGSYFREFFSSTLRGVSQLITQMLVLRLVAGIGGALVGGAAAPAGASVIDSPQTEFGLLPFADGGLVPGRDRGRDSVLAGLRPEEFVLTPEATRRAGAGRLKAFNDGGPVPPAIGGGGAGGGVTIVNNFYVNGQQLPSGQTSIDQRSLAAIEQAIGRMYHNQLRNNASLRDEARRLTQ